MTGWRIGWIAARPTSSGRSTHSSQAAGNSCSISQAAAAAALSGDQSFVRESLATYRQRRDATAAGINAIPGLSCAPPEGAFYLFVECAGLIGRRTPDGKLLESDGDVTLYLLDQAGVAVVARRRLRPLALLQTLHCDITGDLAGRRAENRRRRGRTALIPRLKEPTMPAIETHPSAAQADAKLIEALKRSRSPCQRPVPPQPRQPGPQRLPQAGTDGRTAVTVKTRGGDNLAILRAYDYCRPAMSWSSTPAVISPMRWSAAS